MKVILTIPLLFISLSCVNISGLNMQEHLYGATPEKIVWLQIPGLAIEHLALLKYSSPHSLYQTNFEKAGCVGRLWNYNLYKLRPNAYESMLSQITGKKNIKNSCDDFSQKPIWSYLTENEYKVGIFESNSNPKNSLIRAKKCSNTKKKNNFLTNTYTWIMKRPSKELDDTFHMQEEVKYIKGKIYYDKSCAKNGTCFSSVNGNIQTLYKSFTKDTHKYFFLIRDFSYYNHIKNKKINLAKESLRNINQLLGKFYKEIETQKNLLVIVSSAAPQSFEFPKSGKPWQDFEAKGKNIYYHRNDLLSPIFVKGARAENFCGIFDEAEILKRVMNRTNPGSFFKLLF